MRILNSIETPPRHVIGVTTEVAYYYLNEPSDDYLPFMREIDTKTFIAKCVIEHLVSTRDSMEEVEYEDLLTVLEERAAPEGVEKINEDAVVKHADFLVSQVHLIRFCLFYSICMKIVKYLIVLIPPSQIIFVITAPEFNFVMIWDLGFWGN